MLRRKQAETTVTVASSRVPANPVQPSSDPVATQRPTTFDMNDLLTPPKSPPPSPGKAAPVQPSPPKSPDEETKDEIPRIAHNLPAHLDDRDDVLSVIHELEDQLDRYEEIRAGLERQLTEQAQGRQTAEQRVQELEWRLVATQTKLEASEQLRQEVTLLEEELGDANAKITRFGTQLAQVESENTRLTEESRGQQKELEELWALRKERDGLRTEVKNARGRVDHLQRVLEEATEERNGLSGSLQKLQAQFDEVQNQNRVFSSRLQTTLDEKTDLDRSVTTLSEKLAALRAEKKNLHVELTHAQRENARLTDQHKFLESEITKLRSANRGSEAALASVKQAFAEVRVALTETRSRARRRTIESWQHSANSLANDIPVRVVDADEKKPDSRNEARELETDV